MSADPIPDTAIAEVADILAEKIDLLLERAADTVLGAPNPGSPQWRHQWENRETSEGRAAHTQRMLVRLAIANRAGIDPRNEIDRALRAGVAPPRIAAVIGPRRQPRVRRPAGRPSTEDRQLSIW